MTALDPVLDLARSVRTADATVHAVARDRLARLAVPPGALGAFEPLAARLAAAAGRCPPPVPIRPALVVAAADHGVHARGVSPWPQEVTSVMTALLARGVATASAFARSVGAEVWILDAGLATEVPAHPRLRRLDRCGGTRDLTVGPALRPDEVAAAVLAGAAIADEALADGADLLVTGEMGIANTTAAACLVASLTGVPAARVTGPGAGGGATDLGRKRRIVAEAVAARGVARTDGLGALAAFGGLEHAALVGVCLAGAAARVPVVLDGVNALASALAAVALAPALTDHLVAGHRSPEPGATVALATLGLHPLLDLRLAVGEGTGGLLAVPLVSAACRLLVDVADLEGVAAGPPG